MHRENNAEERMRLKGKNKRHKLVNIFVQIEPTNY